MTLNKNTKTTKERLLLYLKEKSISKVVFVRKTGIKRGFLDSDKLEGKVSDLHMKQIMETYPDLNLIWMISGKGKMIIENSEDAYYTIDSITKYIISNESDFLKSPLFLKMMDVLFAERNLATIQSKKDLLLKGFKREMNNKIENI